MFNQGESSIIEVVDVKKVVDTAAGELTILHGINFQIKSAATVAITGVSGSGKSTLLGILAGLDTSTSGSVLVTGKPFHQLDEDGRAQVRAESVGFVFQTFQLIPTLTVLENVLLPLELRGDSAPRQGAEQLLERVGLAHRFDHYPRQLSGGEQQRVAIARAFVTRPAILFADEPTGNLDSKTGETITELLFELNREQGTTLVLVTHDNQLAQRCEQQLVMDVGTILPAHGDSNTTINSAGRVS